MGRTEQARFPICHPLYFRLVARGIHFLCSITWQYKTPKPKHLKPWGKKCTVLRPGFGPLLERPWGKDAYFYICVSGGRLSHCSKASTPPRPQPLHLHVAYSTLVAVMVISVSLTVGFSFFSWGNCMWMPSIAHHYRFKAHVCVRFSLYLVKRNGGGLWSCQREATTQHLWWLLTQVDLGYCISLPL